METKTEKFDLCGIEFEGIDTGDRWNGFKVPMFTRAEAARIIKTFTEVTWEDTRENEQGFYVFDGFVFE